MKSVKNEKRDCISRKQAACENREMKIWNIYVRIVADWENVI